MLIEKITNRNSAFSSSGCKALSPGKKIPGRKSKYLAAMCSKRRIKISVNPKVTIFQNGRFDIDEKILGVILTPSIINNRRKSLDGS